MDYAEALRQIESLENGNELISAIKGRVDGILEEKRRAVSSSSTERDRASQLENIVDQIFKLTGAEGDNPVAKTQSFTNKYNSLLSESNNNQKTISSLEAAKNAAEQAKNEAETKLIEADRNIKVTEAAIASKANPNVLKKLLTDNQLSLEVSTAEDNSKQVLVVKGEEKLPLTEFAQSNWADFLPSLFPSSGSTPPKPPSVLPGGSPGGQKKENPDPVKSYIAASGYGLKTKTTG
ncbi:hypothetical protein [Chroococcidiopsis sp.]|uniref:hypothetical protein n=1 Tax=Chroococcidiopsis sp. TaxID=3088168 RepID=UPI003F34F6C5